MTVLGGDCWCDNRSNVCHDFAQQVVSLSQPLLGGIDTFIHHPPTAQRQGWWYRLSYKPRLIQIVKIFFSHYQIRGHLECNYYTLFGGVIVIIYLYGYLHNPACFVSLVMHVSCNISLCYQYDVASTVERK